MAKTLQVKLTDEQEKWLQEQAKKLGFTKGAYVKFLLNNIILESEK